MLEKINVAMGAVLLDYLSRIKAVEVYPYSPEFSEWREALRKWEAAGCEVLSIGGVGQGQGQGELKLIVFEGKGDKDHDNGSIPA